MSLIISIASGKGGTGKTSVSASLAAVWERPLVAVDLDVEEPNLHLFLKPELAATEVVHLEVPVLNDKPLGLTAASWKALAPHSESIHWSTASMRIGESMGLTGPIPRRHPEGQRSGPFFLDPAGREHDELEDDQALWIWTLEGLVVVLGCAHAGVFNTLDHIASITGERRVRALIGGLHLSKAGQERLDFTGAALRAAGIDEVLTCHCTGETVVRSLDYRWMRAGDVWESSGFRDPVSHS